MREIIRQLRLGGTVRGNARDMGISRNTVAKYQEHQLLTAPELPSMAELVSIPAPKLPKLHREVIVPKRQQSVELRALLRLLQEKRGITGSYSALRRFVRKFEHPEASVRSDFVEVASVDGCLLARAKGSAASCWRSARS